MKNKMAKRKETKYIIIHCTATQQTSSVESILDYWKNVLGWKNPGYYALVEPNGDINFLSGIDDITNGVKGMNHKSIHISYIGGVTKSYHPIDNRTQEQKESLLKLIKTLKHLYPDVEVYAHNDFTMAKACPSFSVKEWLKENGIDN